MTVRGHSRGPELGSDGAEREVPLHPNNRWQAQLQGLLGGPQPSGALVLLPALRARERERAAKTVAGSFQFGRAHVLLVWPEGPRREAGRQPDRPEGPRRGGRGAERGAPPGGDLGGRCEKVTRMCRDR